MSKRKKTSRTWVKGITFLLILTLGLFFALFRPLPAPIKPEAFLKSLDSLTTKVVFAENNVLQAGWGKASLLPNEAVSLAGYGPRGSWEEVLDTPEVRVFVFKKGLHKVAIICADLLLFPPKVRRLLDEELRFFGFEKEAIFYTATHSHNSIGGWLPGYGAKYLAGEYDPSIPRFIAEQTVSALTKALHTLEPAEVGYLHLNAPQHTRNRLVKNAYADPYLRGLYIEKAESKTKALWLTYSAHATTLKGRSPLLSRDYAGVLVQELEDSLLNFAAFSAGAVGSHSPKVHAQAVHREAMQQMGKALADSVAKNIHSIPFQKNCASISFFRLPLALNAAPRVLEHFQLRPWVFNTLLEKPDVYLSVLRLGEITLLGTPCDFSGELMPELEKKTLAKHLILTSFNGGYVGYVTKDSRFTLKKHEVREMNWIGAGGGEYFTTLLRASLKKVKTQKTP